MRNLRLATTFFKNQQYYEETYIDWYSKHFNNNEFVFFIGDPDLDSNDMVVEKKTLGGGRDVIYLRYKSGGNNPDQWHNVKQRLWNILRAQFDDRPTIVTDCDELIYTKNLDKCIKEGQIKTHFYEYKVDEDEFSLNKNSIWVEQGWYYKMQLNNQYKKAHGGCKKYFFDKRDFEHMGKNNTYCNNNIGCDWKKYENICFHISVTSINQYYETKQWAHLSKYTDRGKADMISESDFNKNFFKVDKVYDTFNLKLSDLLT